MVRSTERKGLGRGLSALMADVGAPDTGPSTSSAGAETLPIEVIHPKPDQPRQTFGDQELNELAQSIAHSGILQPLIVRPDPNEPSRYQIVAGERRWRAAQRAKVHEVPVLVRNLTDEEVLEFSIVENIQRVDLNPLEEADSYRRLIDTFGHTQEALAKSLGKSRSHIANTLRLLNLPGAAQECLRDGRISAGHARAILSSAAPEVLLQEILSQNLTVRQAEARAKSAEPRAQTRKKPGPQKDADTRAIEAELSAILRMRVQIDHPEGAEGGTLSIKYKSLTDLDKILGALGGGWA